ncbi:STAS domain-containing protein [Marinobacter salicampi]|uniref:STAS domain-containing protein n=1 Tax=Marinobacter salicampi TaxID=435907 RepID=UPI001409766D|nr:STAS domain-containing protein [Marinobacter salicampi]
MASATAVLEPDQIPQAPAIRQLSDHKLAVSGQVDASSVLPLRAEGERLIGACQPEQNLCIDLAELATASSIVLSLLLCWQRQATARKITLQYSSVGERLHALASLSNLDKHLSGF